MSTPISRRDPYAKTFERRAGIAQAALCVVLAKGHRGLTTAGVAERAGISERTIPFPMMDLFDKGVTIRMGQGPRQAVGRRDHAGVDRRR